MRTVLLHGKKVAGRVTARREVVLVTLAALAVIAAGVGWLYLNAWTVPS